MTNLFEIMGRNKHGDYQEVNFTSVLSYLLDPNEKHGLKDILLNEILSRLIPDYGPSSDIKVRCEENLGKNSGNIDIYIDAAKYIVGIEAKIWDNSADNISKEGKHQLERYYDSLSEIAKDRDFYMLFLIPNENSPKCLEEYEFLRQKNKIKNVKLMAWVFSPDESITDDFISESIWGVLSKLNQEENISGPNSISTKWILNSLIEFLPSFDIKPKEEKRFPSKKDLQKIPGIWNLYEPFLQVGIGNQGVRSQHTVIGIPYEFGDKKGKLHNSNALYRIRTTRSYYSDLTEKEKYLPSEYIEIELWPDIYDQVRDKLDDWRKKNDISEPTPGKHLDEFLNVDVKVLKISKGLEDEAVSEFNSILKDGYSYLWNKIK